MGERLGNKSSHFQSGSRSAKETKNACRLFSQKVQWGYVFKTFIEPLPYFMPAATHRSANTDIGDKVVAFMEVIRLQVETGLQKVTTHCSIISAIYNRGKIQGMLSHKEGGSYCILLWGHQGRLPKKRTTGLSFLRLSIISQLRKG